MYISRFSLRNFRNFHSVSLGFTKGVNTIIGENGAGKSNLFHAIRIMIDDSMPRSIRFYENDFNRSIGNWAGHWIVIQIIFDDLDNGEEAQSIAMHKIADAENYDSTKGTYTLFFVRELILGEVYSNFQRRKIKHEKSYMRFCRR